MGWNSWNKFHCDISGDLIKKAADKIVELGLSDLGYTYVNIDDCWQASSRD
jgi:alpha-galactosidase